MQSLGDTLRSRTLEGQCLPGTRLVEHDAAQSALQIDKCRQLFTQHSDVIEPEL